MRRMSTSLPFEPQPGALAHCELCQRPGGLLVWRDADWRVIRVEDADFPAFYRVVSGRHVAELSDLSPAQRERCMALVCAVERVLIERLRPSKVNLAALGNVVPHLHWHVVARFEWDSHFPQPIWGLRQRDVAPPAVQRLAISLGLLDAAVAAALGAA
jgi:diadenosine tetraphosphate (Ap4A) HIT family hydrolase